MKNLAALFMLLVLPVTFVWAQKLAPDTYWVQFTDKNGTPYSLSNPKAFLTEKALERRTKQNIPLTSTDLPVNPAYTDSLQALSMDVLYTSRWFNAAVVQSYDSLLIDTLENYGFISNYHSKLTEFANWFNDPNISDIPYSLHQTDFPEDSVYDYGEAANQIKMLNADALHNMGYSGQNILVAVLDAGFYKVDEFRAFDSLITQNRIKDSWDFVRNDSLSYRSSTHGMKVLSTMAGLTPGRLVGTAPKATYCLYRSENASSEYLVEEANWIAAAERADSLGVDIINTSLGYSDFDDPAMSHSYTDMDGRSTLISIAADMAVSKGMVVVASAGNEGASSWGYITAPADAYHILSIGAVDNQRERIYFSSVGPTFDGRIKPDVSAKGYFASVQSFSGNIGYANGTSFAAPITAGAVACLWQARPELSNLQIVDVVRKISSRYMTPDSLLGYGIPDFSKGYYYPNTAFVQNIHFNDMLDIYPNPFEDKLKLNFNFFTDKATQLKLYTPLGHLVKQVSIPAGQMPATQKLPLQIKNLTQGMYILQIINGKHKYQQKIIKQ